MSAIDERLLELVHADLDRELTAAERAELGRGLIASSEANRLHSDLRRLQAQIRAVAQVEPPGELRQEILDGLAAAGNGRPSLGWSHRASTSLRYAAVFCGGVILTGIVLRSDIGEQPESDPSALIGTMVRQVEPSSESGVDEVRLLSARLSGQVSLHRVSPGVLLVFELSSAEPIDVVATRGGQEIRASGLAGPGTHNGERYAILLPDSAGANDKVDLKIFSSGSLISEHTLSPRGAP